jgi:hypothetical protein
MRKATLSLTALGAMALPFLDAAPASAQATRTWVSGTGSDANPCSRTAPCQTWSGALSKTAINGEINCIDAGGFGAVTIAKSITIDCGGFFGSALSSGVSGMTVNAPGANVVIRNVSINGTSGCAAGGVQPCAPATPGLNGIRFLQTGSLHVDNVIVQNFTAAGNGNCIDFRPTGASKLVVSNSYFYNCGSASTGAGVLLRPTAGGTAAVISKTVIDRSFQGIVADGTGGGSVNVSMHDSVVSGSAASGVLATSAGTAVAVLVDRSDIFGNGTGLNATGNANAIIRVGNSTITGNGTATAAVTGQVLSYLNNFLNANGVDTAPPGVPGGMH